MKRILFFLLLIQSIAFGQAPWYRSKENVTPIDPHLWVTKSFKLPVFSDTASATVSGRDTVGRFVVISSTWDTYVRAKTGSVKYWKKTSGTGGGSITVPGSNKNVIFNNSGSLAAVDGFIYDASSGQSAIRKTTGSDLLTIVGNGQTINTNLVNSNGVTITDSSVKIYKASSSSTLKQATTGNFVNQMPEGNGRLALASDPGATVRSVGPSNYSLIHPASDSSHLLLRPLASSGTIDYFYNSDSSLLVNYRIGSDQFLSGTSGTVTDVSRIMVVNINPASTLSTFTLYMPASPISNSLLYIVGGGTMTSGTAVTTLTINGNGNTVIGTSSSSLSVAGPNKLLSYTQGKWFVLQ